MKRVTYYKRRAIQRYIEDYVASRSKKKLGGPLYWIILTVVLFEDTSDLFADILLAGIQIIPGIGQALGGVVCLINTLLGFYITGIVFLYLFSNRGGFVSKKVGKAKFWLFKTMALMLADSIPILGMLPFTTLAFMYAVKTINKGRKKDNEALPQKASANIS